jgi:aspartokinase
MQRRPMRVVSRWLVVTKLGGSVLADDSSYGEVARSLVRRLQRRNEERLVVVVSARKGTVLTQ